MTRGILALYAVSALVLLAAIVKVWREDLRDDAERKQRALRELE